MSSGNLINGTKAWVFELNHDIFISAVYHTLSSTEKACLERTHSIEDSLTIYTTLYIYLNEQKQRTVHICLGEVPLYYDVRPITIILISLKINTVSSAV